MNSLEPKKLALIRILQIMNTYTDCDHPLTHDEIKDKLQSLYSLAVERKMIGRNLALLKDADYDIRTTKQGSYMASRLFDDSELRLLCDSVLSCRHIPSQYSRDLIEKLSSLSSKYFKSHVKNVCSVNDWDKSHNKALFYNIEIVDEAIEKKVQIKFDYNKYEADKQLHRTATHIVTPYQMVLRNQHYFLMAYSETWKNIIYFRMDKITDIGLLQEPATELRTVQGYESGIDYKRIASAMPYMFSDTPERVTFSVADEQFMIDQVVDWFGYSFDTTRKDGKLLVSVSASPMAMQYWAMQYLDQVEILYPQSLRQTLAEHVSAANKKYNP